MKSLKNDLFSKFENNVCKMNDVIGGTLTSLGQTNLDHYGSSGCDDIEYSLVSVAKDRNWTELRTASPETFLVASTLKSSLY